MNKSGGLFFKLIIAVLIIAVLSLVGLSAVYRLFPIKYYDSVSKYCSVYNVDQNIILALIKAESNFNENALSDAGAKGLMQLTDDTFEFCERYSGLAPDSDIFSADDNICAGVWYFSFLIKKYNGNVKNAVAAYNAGFATVDKWLVSKKYSSDGKTLSVVPYGETYRHVKKITKYRKIYDFLY